MLTGPEHNIISAEKCYSLHHSPNIMSYCIEHSHTQSIKIEKTEKYDTVYNLLLFYIIILYAEKTV